MTFLSLKVIASDYKSKNVIEFNDEQNMYKLEAKTFTGVEIHGIHEYLI